MPIHYHSQLKVLYIIRWNPKKIQKKIQTIRQPPYKETIGDSGKKKIHFNNARGGAAIYCDLLLNVTYFWTYFSSATSADRSFSIMTLKDSLIEIYGTILKQQRWQLSNPQRAN